MTGLQVIEGGGVSTTVLAELAGVSVQAVRLACRSGNLDARRDRHGAWQVQAASAVRYATEQRAGAARLDRDPRPGDITISLSAAEVRALFHALSLAVTFTRRRRSQCLACRLGRCAEHPNRARQIEAFGGLQDRLRQGAGQ